MDITEEIHDFVVAGSGFSGAMAAQTLIEKGARVLMIDAGAKPGKRITNPPSESFLQIRRNDANQHLYWLGEDFESISWNKTGALAQLTPSRQYVSEGVAEFLPVISDAFNAIESLGRGGLGEVWGLGCNIFSERELKEAGLSPAMGKAYQTIADRIGISGQNDDAGNYTVGNLLHIQPSIKIDSNSESIYLKYQNRKKTLNKRGFFLGKSSLALLTEKWGGRKAVSYDEMDFYSNRELSAYRPSITIDNLNNNRGFKYLPDMVILHFKEDSECITIHYLNRANREQKSLKCKKLILGTGTLGTTRIVLRSLAGDRTVRLPLLSDPYRYFTLLQPSMLGLNKEEPRTALAQLMLFHDPLDANFDVGAASIYSYRSLMLFRAVKELSLNYRDARILLQYLLPAVSVMGVHHPDAASPLKYAELIRDPNSLTGDALKITYSLSGNELKKINGRERKFSAAMRTLGCFTLKKTDPGYGSSVHYAGCLSFNANKNFFYLHPSGRLQGTRNVFVADGSGFSYLPAKGITLSLMANAHLVALNTLQIT